MLRDLSEEAAAAYTDALLRVDVCYEPWVMWHIGSSTREKYPKMDCEPLPVRLLRSFGRVRTPAGIAPLAVALGPRNSHPQPAESMDLHTCRAGH